MSLSFSRNIMIDTTTYQSVVSSNVDLGSSQVGCVQVIHGAADVTARVFASSAVDTTNDLVTLVAHGLITGTVGQLTTTGALPTGLSLATNYFIIRLSADTFAFATSLANAIAGTKIDLTAQGSGNDTFTPSAKSGSLQYQVSNVALPDAAAASTDWVNKGSAVTISGAAATTSAEYSAEAVAYRWFRAVYTHTSGQYSLQSILNLKG